MGPCEVLSHAPAKGSDAIGSIRDRPLEERRCLLPIGPLPSFSGRRMLLAGALLDGVPPHLPDAESTACPTRMGVLDLAVEMPLILEPPVGGALGRSPS